MKKKEIAELAKKMKTFEKEIICESKDVTLKAFWEPESDGSGVYVVEYHRGKTVSSVDMSWDGDTFYIYWGFNYEYKKETPKMFANILYELEKMLNQ